MSATCSVGVSRKGRCNLRPHAVAKPSKTARHGVESGINSILHGYIVQTYN